MEILISPVKNLRRQYMALYFDCYTNGKPYINYAVFTDGTNEYKVDRDWTYFDLEGKYLSMEWTGLYVWNEDKRTDIDDSWFENKKFIKLETEDDADIETGAKYYCTPIKVMYGDELKEIKHQIKRTK